MSKKCILIIDDQDAVRIFLSTRWAEKYEVLLAKTGEEGLEILEKEPVDLVLTDDTMPGIHGLQVLATIKNKYKGLPAIYMTANGTIDQAREVESQGFRFIPKPMDLEILESMIAELVQSHS